jgi:hypothetical protein
MTKPNTSLSPASLKKRMIEIFKSESAYFEALKQARADLITYFDKGKLYLLFTKAIDACPYVDFATPRDRRVNKKSPVYKLKIDYGKLPADIRAVASRKLKISDAKTCIVHQGVLGPYLDSLLNVIKTNDTEFLKEPIPSQEQREGLQDYLSAMYIMDTGEEPEKPIFVRQII